MERQCLLHPDAAVIQGQAEEEGLRKRPREDMEGRGYGAGEQRIAGVERRGISRIFIEITVSTGLTIFFLFGLFLCLKYDFVMKPSLASNTILGLTEYHL